MVLEVNTAGFALYRSFAIKCYSKVGVSTVLVVDCLDAYMDILGKARHPRLIPSIFEYTISEPVDNKTEPSSAWKLGKII